MPDESSKPTSPLDEHKTEPVPTPVPPDVPLPPVPAPPNPTPTPTPVPPPSTTPVGKAQHLDLVPLPGLPPLKPGIYPGDHVACPAGAQPFVSASPVDYVATTDIFGHQTSPPSPAAFAMRSRMWFAEFAACTPGKSKITAPDGDKFIVEIEDAPNHTSYAEMTVWANDVMNGIGFFDFDPAMCVVHASFCFQRNKTNTPNGSREWDGFDIIDVNDMLVDTKELDGATLSRSGYCTSVVWMAESTGLTVLGPANHPGKAPAAGNIQTWDQILYQRYFSKTDGANGFHPDMNRGGSKGSTVWASKRASDGKYFNGDVTTSKLELARGDIWYGKDPVTLQDRYIVAEDGILQLDTGFIPVNKSLPPGRKLVGKKRVIYHSGLRLPLANPDVALWDNLFINLERGFPIHFPMIFR